MGTILALAAALLYGSADFLGGAAARKARRSQCWPSPHPPVRS